MYEEADAAATRTVQLREWADTEKVRFVISASGTSTNSITANGRTERTSDAQGLRYEFVEEILEAAPGKKVTRARRVYTTAEVTAGGITTPEVFQNKTVLISKEADRYVFRLKDGRQITGPDAQHLVESFNDLPPYRRQELFPDRPVKRNETWTISKAVAIRIFTYPSGMKIDPETTTASGKLTRVYQKDSRQFGTVCFHGEIGITDPNGAFGAGVGLRPGGRFVCDTTIDVCIDGSVPGWDLTGRCTGEFALVPPGGADRSADIRVRLELQGKMSSGPAR